ncbi:indole-3-glycerol phosphate synthase TrpC [Sphingopyxis macrogoltabida]|uniref:indole-3-glycerol phosphate synthase TrpC n=1 Tax=Sphingopyxis macrogoltabida TaxID=33050 RepID=UPI0006ED0739|nr:indole-3-glycerol phosphate synthase TrpC [Sphingopyxis macrogoltabida]ALJ14690.1 serine/threonine-protein kinase TTK/MPS1 [Sphingopyxis macrogoltabida]
MNKLAQILDTKAKEVAARRRIRSIGDLDRIDAGLIRGFEAALRERVTNGDFALIAEIKRASPSRGLIREDFHPPSHARAYEEGGATCLSVLTDAPWFEGHEDYLIAARAACDLPVLRKDFMIDPWQVAEARAIGADAILIIVAALSDGAMQEIEAAAIERGLDVLVEVHDDKELDRAVSRLRSRLIGINSRDLRTFATDLGVAERLAKRVPQGTLVVGESGIRSHADCARLAASGIRSFLVGETLMRSHDIAAATQALFDADAVIPAAPRLTTPTRRSARAGRIIQPV